jgi:S-adenosylmethionine:tRNA ribosyltransferase-isomerase
VSKNFENFLKAYDYFIPPKLIAKKPASPRDSAKLLIYKKKSGEVVFDRFSNLTKYLPEKAVLIFNDTKVLPARLVVKKETGGLAKILYLETKGKHLKFLSDRNLVIGSKIFLNKKIFFTVRKKEGKYYFLESSFLVSKIFEVLEKHGLTPIPPYIKNSPLSEKELRQEYQTIFASQKGSVAAPTASLHFTKGLLNKIRKSGRKIVFITLHVNLGTFNPLEEENFKKSKLHTEYYEISGKSAEILNKAKKEKQPIIAVGTTAVRTLESASNENGILLRLKGETDIFIKEGYRFRFVNGIITNFHVPKSSLMMLVSAFVERKKLLGLYQKAINKNFRFFSFGDGMIVL